MKMKKYISILVLGILIVSGVHIEAKEKGYFKGTMFLDSKMDFIELNDNSFRTYAAEGFLILQESNHSLFKVGIDNLLEVKILTSRVGKQTSKGGNPNR